MATLNVQRRNVGPWGPSPLLALEQKGYAVAPTLLESAEADAIAEALAGLRLSSAGTRNMLEIEWCRTLAVRVRSGLKIRGVAVQCTLFDKTPEKNWLVAFHQDLTIPVREKVEHPELRAWSVKEGQHFVQPPVALLEQLISVRVHIDECGPDNGPLRLIPASHRRGHIDEVEATRLRSVSGEVLLPIRRGGALLMKPLVLHASSKATSPGHRRVLQFLFGPPTIEYGLRWRHSV